MKKIIMLASFLLTVAMASIPFAIPVSATDSTEATEEAYVSQAPWEYGEMKDGLFVRTSAEDMSWMSPDDPNYMTE